MRSSVLGLVVLIVIGFARARVHLPGGSSSQNNDVPNWRKNGFNDVPNGRKNGFADMPNVKRNVKHNMMRNFKRH